MRFLGFHTRPVRAAKMREAFKGTSIAEADN